MLVPYCYLLLGGVFPSPSPLLPRDFISGLGKMILYFRKDFQNLAADQKQNHAALHCTTPARINGINTKKCSTRHKRNFSIKISSKTDFVFAVLFDLDRATCSANMWLLDERRHTGQALQERIQHSRLGAMRSTEGQAKITQDRVDTTEEDLQFVLKICVKAP